MEKRRASPDSLADEWASPKRIELCSPLTSTTTELEEPFPYYKRVLEYLIDDDDLEEIANEVFQCGGDIVVILKDFLTTLALGSESTITDPEALLHFNKVKSIWGNKQFLGVLFKMRTYLPQFNKYADTANVSLSYYLADKIRNDPSFKEDICETKDKDESTRMRNALSILIGYWSNEDMITVMLSIGGPSLCSLLDIVKVDDVFLHRGEVNGNTMSREFSTPIEGCSPIGDLRNDKYIKELADHLSKNGEAVSLADKYLAALKGVEGTTSYSCHLCHSLAASTFWTDSVILVPLVEALRRESTPLVGIFRKYSKTAQCLRCLDRLTHIQKDSLVKAFLESGDPAFKTRGALSVLFGYWSDGGMRELFRELSISRRDLKGLDDIKYLEYFRRHLGDFEGLRKVLAEKEYTDLLEEIKTAQQTREQEPDHVKKILNIPGVQYRQDALIKVLLQNSTVIRMVFIGL